MKRGALATPALAAAGVVTWLYSLGALLDQPRRTFVALRYFQAAQSKLTSRPVDRPGAARDLRRSLQLAPTDPLILRRAADLFIAAEAYDDALKVYRRRRPGDLLGLIGYGQCLMLTDRVAAGQNIVLKAAALARVEYRRREISRAEYATIANNAAYALSLAGVSLQQARALAEDAVSLAPLQPAFCDTLGWVLFALGRSTDAAFYLERAVRWTMTAPDPVVLYHLGAVYAAAHRVEDARRLLLRSIALDPSRRDAIRQLRRLYQVLPEPAYVLALPRLELTAPPAAPRIAG